MSDSKDRLFVGTLAFALLMTLVFGAALAWDITNNRGGAGTSQRTVTGGGSTADPNAAGNAGSAGSAGGTSRGSGGSGGGGASANADVVPAGADIQIGSVITQSGPLDASDAFKAQEAYVQMVNASGGVNGHHIKLDVQNDNGDPGVGKPAFEKIVQEEKALAIVGECAPLTDVGIINEISQFQVPVINDCLTGPAAYGNPYIWFSTQAPGTWQQLSATYLHSHADQLKFHKPWVLCVDTIVTRPYCDGFVKGWTAAGGSTCSHNACGRSDYDTEQVATTRTQYDLQASSMKASGADSIVALLEPTNEAAFLQALTDQGMCNSNGWAQYAPLGSDPSAIRAGGNCAIGLLASTSNSYFPSENTPGEQQLGQALSRYQPGTPLDNYALSIGWTPMVLFGEAVRRAGPNLSRQTLINALNSMNGYDTNGLCKGITWTSGNHLAPASTRWARVTGPATYDVFTGWEG
ncbi:MAG TPA: ABC transporter substrate-binding protein [Candidatus Dormibacteraeota bacterium]|nr:ABC transporter substrate-binding protein [Candidatus Dormibacteraeota bacterium]